MRVKILGAGSVGNHLAFSCRKHDLDVTVMDINTAALALMQEETYPSRYGFWDSAIKITHSDNDDALWDLIIIATPPDSHLELANKIIQKNNTEALLIEKPLGPPKLEDILRFRTNCSNSAMKIFIGYNHVLTPHSVQFENVARELTFANPLQLNVFFKEHWQGICI